MPLSGGGPSHDGFGGRDGPAGSSGSGGSDSHYGGLSHGIDSPGTSTIGTGTPGSKPGDRGYEARMGIGVGDIAGTLEGGYGAEGPPGSFLETITKKALKYGKNTLRGILDTAVALNPIGAAAQLASVIEGDETVMGRVDDALALNDKLDDFVDGLFEGKLTTKAKDSLKGELQQAHAFNTMHGLNDLGGEGGTEAMRPFAGFVPAATPVEASTVDPLDYIGIYDSNTDIATLTLAHMQEQDAAYQEALAALDQWVMDYGID